MGGSRRVAVRRPDSGARFDGEYVCGLVAHTDSGVTAELGRVSRITHLTVRLGGVHDAIVAQHPLPICSSKPRRYQSCGGPLPKLRRSCKRYRYPERREKPSM